MKRLWRAPLFSARGFLLRAIVIAVLYGVAHLCQLRCYASILSGTAPTGDAGAHLPALLGCLYVLLHFAFVLAAPVLVLGAGLLALVERRQPS
jgi:hypothetical protein